MTVHIKNPKESTQKRKTTTHLELINEFSKVAGLGIELVVSDTLQPHGLYSPWNSPGQNTRVSSLSLLQGIFSTQGSNPGLVHCRQILYQLSHKESPRLQDTRQTKKKKIVFLYAIDECIEAKI